MKGLTRRLRALSASLVLVLALVLVAGAAPLPALAEDAAQTAYSAAEPPTLTSSKALLVERETGTTLLEVGADERAYPASLTKVMTALVVLENADLDAEVTVEEGDLDEVTWDSSIAGLKVGETLTVRDLLACLLVPSGNDASYVLARFVGGGDWHAFVDMMNQRAAQLGCEGTHFANPCGLHDDNHYSTARDLVRIFEAALTHPEFEQIAGSESWNLPETSQNPARTLESTDALLDPESPVYMGDTVVASKTGTTLEGGRCLITLAQRDGRTLVGVVLGAPMDADAEGVTSNFYDMRSLLEWGFGAWRTGDVVAVGDVVGSAEVSLSSDGDAVDALATSSIAATVPAETTLDDLTLTPSWDEAFQAPLDADAPLGKVSVSLGDRELGTVTVAAAHAMALSIPSYLVWWLTSDPVHTLLAVVGVVAVLVVVGLIASAPSRSRRRRSKATSSPQRRAVARSVEPKRLKTPAKAKGKHIGSHMRR